MSASEKEFFVEGSFNLLLNDLTSFGNQVSDSEKASLKNLQEVFFDGLSGVLPPSFYLNSLPPGSGKTQAISSFVRVWKERGFKPSGGILIGLKTKDEIERLVARLGLAREDFACLTRDDRVNALGRPDSGNAPVLLTTQQMIIRRTDDRSFAAAKDFHFKGHPRLLRIWDESFSLAENAVDYAGGGLVTVERAAARLNISIIDSGPGIPAFDRDRLLRPFERGEASRNRGTGGQAWVLVLFATSPRGIAAALF